MKLKINNENDMLGLLLKLEDENHTVQNQKLIDLGCYENYSFDILIKELIRKHYVIYTLDQTTITMLGINNYISKTHSICRWIIILLKFVVSYTLGVFSGVIATWLVVKLGIG